MLCLSLAFLFLTGCAASAHSFADPAASSPQIDAVLPSNESWTLFQLGGLRYARVPATEEAFAKWPSGIQWLAIPSPDGAFRPVQALPAARGYFYLVDAGSSRLCLYDTAAGLISTFPLPERFTPFSAGRVALFRGGDGTFIFADYAAGEAWLYTDREGLEGKRAWILRARTKMPLGWRECVQQPGSEEIACRSGGAAIRFDGALNRIPAGGGKAFRGSSSTSTLSLPPSRLTWDPEAREWRVEGFSTSAVHPIDGESDSDSSQGGQPLFRFHPVRRTLVLPPSP